MDIDAQKLSHAVYNYTLEARRISPPGSPATVDDIDRLVRETARLLNVFIEELEDAEHPRKDRQLPLTVFSLIVTTPRFLSSS